MAFITLKTYVNSYLSQKIASQKISQKAATTWEGILLKQAVGGRPPWYAPTPLLPLWAPKRRQAHRNVAVVSHAQYIPTLTAAAVCIYVFKAAVGKAAW